MTKKILKKNTFLQGAFIATLGIVISKIIGLLYVIPFYSLIGDQGGALYGYAYNVYDIFMGIAYAGIPFAISKLISEYNELEYYETKRRVFKLGKKVLEILGIICFILLFVFAEVFAKIIIKDITGGNTISDVTFAIRMISWTILIVPIMSCYRGYLQGHKFITPTSISQVLEQLVRVTIILVGCYLSINVFKLGVRNAVGIAVFSAAIGALVAYIYLLIKTIKNKSVLEKENIKVKEPKISDQEIIKKIIIYAFPFIMIDVFRSLYNSVDVVMLVSVLVKNLHYSVTDAEAIMSVISTWGLKINMIIISLGTGLMVSLIPNISGAFIRKDYDELRLKINKCYQMLLYFVIPMAVGLSILAKPVWISFYGINNYGVSVYSFYVYVALATTIFTCSVTILQMLKRYKTLFVALFVGFLTNCLLNIPLLLLFDKIGLPAYFGSTLSTILGFMACSLICLIEIKKICSVSYKDTIIKGIKVILVTIVMATLLLLLKIFIPFTSSSRIINIIYIAIYSIIGGIIYLFITSKINIFKEIFGFSIKELVNKKILKNKKKIT